ncbi:kanadaptin [Plakobranchus ocellatus]|uniref:Kanadaptin n=1 Tax=Plakobranchus ocellatus TaxID=259542 RepID=A0AAV4CF17_9GAST|nr:kanadaptin [Plakobranchus ocellatus]
MNEQESKDNNCANKAENGCGDQTSSTPGEFAIPKLPSVLKRSDHGKSHNQESKETPMDTGSANHPDNSEKLKQAHVPYTEPLWSGKAEENYSFEVLKNGSIIGNVPLSSKPFHVFGRLPSCDVTLEHPSLSRHHAVVQYSAISTETHEKGWYVYDLDSTHGTWLNKKKIEPKVYSRLRVGHILKFGGSSRLHILQGPSEDEEEESEMSVTELKEQKERLVKEAQLLRQAELQEEMERIEADKKAFEDNGCAWGMTDDAEDIGGDNPYASLVAENESLYIDDPKKALKGFYDREGCDLPDYQFAEAGPGKHKCTLDLPVDGPNGEDLVAEAVVSGKRKDAVIACALEACRILDKFGLLRSSTHESRKRKQKKWEEDDFYDSDEDTFLDRTGTIEKKRFQRMKKAGKDEAETYESLLEKYNKVTAEILDIENQLQKAKAEAEALVSEEMDELDAYMVSIKSGAMDTKTRMQLKGNLMRLKTEEQKLRKLVNIAKPASLPPVKPPTVPSAMSVPTTELLSRKLHSHQKHQNKVKVVKTSAQVELKPDDYEEQDEDDEDERAEKESVDRRLHDEDSDSRPRLTTEDNTCTSSTDPIKAKVTKHPAPPKPSQPTISPSATPVVRGPSLPPPANQVKEHRKPFSHPSTAAVLENLDKEQKTSHKKASNYEYDTDPDYAMWLPPSGQTGDGRTSLNEKLGY